MFFDLQRCFSEMFCIKQRDFVLGQQFFLRVLSVYLVFDITNISTIFYEVCHTICAFSDNIYNDDNNNNVLFI